VIIGSADVKRDLLTLACIAAAGFLLAYLVFSRRDL
jgi:hypothetical protein